MWEKERWWRRRGLNPRPPRCERGALPAELLPHLRADMHSLRSPLALSIRAHIAPSRGTLNGSYGGAREILQNNKVFLRAADQCIEQVSGFGRKHAPCTVTTENNLPQREQIGENDMEMRSPHRMESPPCSLRALSSEYARISARGKGSCSERLPRTSISSSRKGFFSGIANRPLVIRGRRMNIKKVHGNRHFPVDTQNAIF